MRVGELLALKWSNVDLEKRILVVKNDQDFTTKSKFDRIIPISTNLSIEKNNDSEYVFKQYSKYYISHSFKKIAESCGINGSIHLHSLRHSFASNLVNKGASLYVVKELMGHQDYKTTQIYAHLQSEALQNAVALLAI